MIEEISIYQFWCSLEYLHKHSKEFHSGSIFITEIIGSDCNHLRVTFFQNSVSNPIKVYTLPKDWRSKGHSVYSVKESLEAERIKLHHR